ncbi:ABC-2 family transporter protein [Peptostreptococcaceae bacterium AS15]|nr:ABC-2 family transporter protein [Peptostreptococcaceae bacterium AS15]
MRNLKITLQLIKIEFLSRIMYKSAIAMSIITDLLLVVMQYSLWKAIYSYNKLAILDFSKMFSYVILVQILANSYPSDVSGHIANLVKSGDISLKLLNPFPFVGQVFIESIGNTIFKLCMLNIPLYIIYFLYGVKLSLINFLYFILLYALSYVFYFFFEVIFGLFSFYTGSIWGLKNFKYVILLLLSGKAIPLNFYPRVLRKILDFLPFKYMFYSPVMSLVENTQGGIEAVLIQTVSIVLIFLLFNVMYRNVIRVLCIQGG